VSEGYSSPASATTIAPAVSEPGYPGGRVGEGAANVDGGPGAVVIWNHRYGACQ
jgi:hypothetical protein